MASSVTSVEHQQQPGHLALPAASDQLLSSIVMPLEAPQLQPQVIFFFCRPVTVYCFL